MNDIRFHPVHGTLATVGSDGRFSFWDKDARTKLKTSEPMEQSITKCAFNHTGQIFAYAVSYDWSKVRRWMNDDDVLAGWREVIILLSRVSCSQMMYTYNLYCAR